MQKIFGLLLLSTFLAACLNEKKASELSLDDTSLSSPAENSFYVAEPEAISISEYRDEDFISVARSAIQAYENRVSYTKWFKPFYAEAATVSCGGVVSGNITVSGTLDCSNYAGKYALVVYGQNAKLDGGANKLKVIFPQGKVGILVYGTSAELKNVEVSNMTNGMGILLYDSNQGKVNNSKANNNLIGITAYAENITMNQPVIENNVATGNSLFGIRINSEWAAGKKVANPVINGNDVSNSGEYALHIRTDNLTFKNNQNVNTLAGSANGWYLTGGNFEFKSITSSASIAVQKTQIFVAEASQVNFNQTKLTGNGGSQYQEAYGLHAYRVQNINSNQSDFKQFDVGAKVSTESGTTSNVNFGSGAVSGNTYAGIILQKYDNSANVSANINNISYANNNGYNVLCLGGVTGSYCTYP